MDEMFDHNHDGKLSDMERMERDYYLTEMTDQSDHAPSTHRSSGSRNVKSKLLGLLFLVNFYSFEKHYLLFLLILLVSLLFVNLYNDEKHDFLFL